MLSATHFKAMGVEEYVDGFLLSSAARTGFSTATATVHDATEIRLNLEMITRATPRYPA